MLKLRFHNRETHEEMMATLVSDNEASMCFIDILLSSRMLHCNRWKSKDRQYFKDEVTVPIQPQSTKDTESLDAKKANLNVTPPTEYYSARVLLENMENIFHYHCSTGHCPDYLGDLD